MSTDYRNFLALPYAELEELKEHLMEEIKTLRKAQQNKKNDSSDEE